MYLPALAELVSTDGLGAAELRVLLRLMAQAPMGECQQVRYSALARTLGLHRNTVARVMTNLVRRGVVVRDPDDPGCCWVNPELFWRGYRTERVRQLERLQVAT